MTYHFEVVPRYSEVDQQGVVFFGHYLTWFDEAFTEIQGEEAGTGRFTNAIALAACYAANDIAGDDVLGARDVTFRGEQALAIAVELPGDGAEVVVGRLDGLIVTGGADVEPGRYGEEPGAHTYTRPDRDAWELALLDAAAAEFARHGIAGARVDRIAAEAPANKAQIYTWFDSKDGLFDAVFREHLDLIVELVPFDAHDLPGYATRLYDAYLRRPEVVLLAVRARLERMPTGDLLVDASQDVARKLAAIEAAQREAAAAFGDDTVFLERYLPPAVDEGEIRAAVEAAVAGGAGQIGAVMGRVLPQFKGRVEGSVINRIAREVLAARAS